MRYLLLTAALVLAACDATDPGTPAADPTPPPASVFTLDPSFPTDAAPGGQTQLLGEHFVQGAARVGIVTTVVGVWLAIPAAVTDAATDVEPVVESGTWIWENTVPINGTTFTLRLEGTPVGSSVDWTMFVSADRPVNGQTYNDFALYTATTSLNGRVGSWQLFAFDGGTRTRVLDADYEVTNSTVAEITYSIPDTNPNVDARGSSVRYESNGSARLFDWHQEPEDFDHLVGWDAVLHAGFIEATNYNGGARSCWDPQLNDSPCTATAQVSRDR